MWLALAVTALRLRGGGWRGLAGPSVSWEGGSLEGPSSLRPTVELVVADASELRASEVVDLHALAVARRSDRGLLVAAPLPCDQVAVDVAVEDTAPVADVFDNRVVYTAYVRANGTWSILARVRQHRVTSRCEAPLPLGALPCGLAPAPPVEPAPRGWDARCAAVPQQDAQEWADRVELAVELAPEEGICLPAGHWHWAGQGAQWAFAELRVLRSAPMVFFVPLGFTGGYVGVQDHGVAKYAIFSLWDQGTKAEVVELGDGVEARRFSGELSGMQVVKPMAWEEEEPLRVLLHVEPSHPPRYSVYWYAPATGQWALFATLRVKPCGITRHTGLGRLSSFIEVFTVSDCVSHRRAAFSLWTADDDEAEWTQRRAATLTGTDTHAKLLGRAEGSSLILDVGADLPPEVGPRGSEFTVSPAPVPDLLAGPKPAGRAAQAGAFAPPDVAAGARDRILDERQPC